MDANIWISVLVYLHIYKVRSYSILILVIVCREGLEGRSAGTAGRAVRLYSYSILILIILCREGCKGWQDSMVILNIIGCEG